MRWLIDGYNVIRADPDLRAVEARGLQAGRAALLRLVDVLDTSADYLLGRTDDKKPPR